MFNVAKRFILIFFVSFIDIALLLNFVTYFGFYGQPQDTYYGFSSFLAILQNQQSKDFVEAANNIFSLSFQLLQSGSFELLDFENFSFVQFILNITGINGTWYLINIIYNVILLGLNGVSLVWQALMGTFALKLPDSIYTYSRIIVNM